jgi:hypothetical protein
VTYYSSVEEGLFETIINKYMSNYHGADHLLLDMQQLKLMLQLNTLLKGNKTWI